MDPDPRRAVLDDPTSDAPRAAYAAWARTAGQEGPAGEFWQEIGLLCPELPGEQPAVARLARSARRRGYTARAHWRGGFVDAVELPAASFLFHAADLFAAHPIAQVRLADKEARPAGPAGGVAWTPTPAAATARYAFQRLGARRGADRPSDLPPELFAAGLPAAPFDTTARADEALSAACVAHGRRLAGLPPLA
jgi:hypothetical protein